MGQIAKTLDNLALPENGDIKAFLDRGRETLDEVKGLTEYQDQKATRLLTIVTFLSALSGVLFARLVDSYPIYKLIQSFGFGAPATWLVLLAYAFFALFALSAACGALVVFHATRTRFKYPSAEPEDPFKRRLLPRSYLFYSDIIELRPESWARAFTKNSDPQSSSASLDPDLAMRYLKNYIAESYLVAAKVADKLRYLHPAQDILAFAVRMLVIWILLFGATIALVPGFAT